MSARSYKRLLEAVARIRRTELAPETWPEALEAVAECLDARKAVSFRVHTGSGEVRGFRDLNIGEAAVSRFAAYYRRLDPWLQGFSPAWQAGSPFRCTEIISDSALRRTEYYNDFIKPLDIRFALSSIPLRSDGWMDVLTFFRGVSSEDFDDASLEVFQVLLEHIAQALDIQRRIGLLEHRARGLGAALDRISQAVIVLDGAGRIIHANAAAQEVFNAADGLAVTDGRIEAWHAGAADALDRALRHVDEVTTPAAIRQRRVISVPRPSGCRAYVLRISPMARDEEVLDVNDTGNAPRALVLINDPDAGLRVPALRELRDVYQLTPTEAALAAAIAEGRTVSEVAAREGIAVDTARKRLKAVFEKTNTHRQSELIRRLMIDLG
jgi:DNA-binding CsgD family transcriptional regulator/PAS domain-containing protein